VNNYASWVWPAYPCQTCLQRGEHEADETRAIPSRHSVGAGRFLRWCVSTTHHEIPARDSVSILNGCLVGNYLLDKTESKLDEGAGYEPALSHYRKGDMQDETLARFTTLVERIGGKVYTVTPEQQAEQERLAIESWQHAENQAAGFFDNEGY